jgi:hypothetical protein
MKLKTIIQTDIAQGSQWGSEETTNFIRNICIPSVKNYCLKNGYNHVLITESQYKARFGKFDFFEKKSKHYAFERYFYLSNYDYSIYIDNDIYAFDHADPLPEINGLMCIEEPHSKSSKIFHKKNNLSPQYPYYNSGVIMCDQTNAKKLCEYMIYRVENKIHARGKNTDNMMLNEYLLENKKKINFTSLDQSWNFMPFLGEVEKINKPNLYHFVGRGGKVVINSFLEAKKEVPDMGLEYFLLNARINLPYF